jgi:hypothetical protein
MNSESSFNIQSPVSASVSASNEPSFLNISWKIWIVIILVLAILGVNIFIYLAKGTQYFATILAKLTAIFGNVFIDTSKQVITTANAGIVNTSNLVSGTLNTGLTDVQNLGKNIQPITVSSTLPPVNHLKNDILSTSLNLPNTNLQTLQGDEASSSIQSGKTTSKSGWCYIGEDRGFRSCAHVNDDQTCMSGDIFPTHDICVNPNLRQ